MSHGSCPKCEELGKDGDLIHLEDNANRKCYYDSYGMFHEHSKKPEPVTYSCENGHRFIDFEYVICPTCNRDYAHKGA